MHSGCLLQIGKPKENVGENLQWPKMVILE